MIPHDRLGETTSSGGCGRRRFLRRQPLERGGQPKARGQKIQERSFLWWEEEGQLGGKYEIFHFGSSETRSLD